jgi:hypothetical protein
MLSRLVDDDTVETMLIHPLTTRIEVEHGVSRYHRLIRKTQIGFLLTLEHRCGIKASIKNAKKKSSFFVKVPPKLICTLHKLHLPTTVVPTVYSMYSIGSI